MARASDFEPKTCLNCGQKHPDKVPCDPDDIENYIYQQSYAKLKDEFRYKRGGKDDIECIDAIKAALTPEEFRGFCKGNVLKYIWRENYKGKDDDLSKAADYINYLIGKAEKIVDSKD